MALNISTASIKLRESMEAGFVGGSIIPTLIIGHENSHVALF
jgi:hypothetical protein